MLCGISCELADCVCTAAYRGLREQDSRQRPNQTLDSYTLAGLAELSRLSSNSLKLPPQEVSLQTEQPSFFHMTFLYEFSVVLYGDVIYQHYCKRLLVLYRIGENPASARLQKCSIFLNQN
jgi:hypothetical protein